MPRPPLFWRTLRDRLEREIPLVVRAAAPSCWTPYPGAGGSCLALHVGMLGDDPSWSTEPRPGHGACCAVDRHDAGGAWRDHAAHLVDQLRELDPEAPRTPAELEADEAIDRLSKAEYDDEREGYAEARERIVAAFDALIAHREMLASVDQSV